MLPEIEDTRSNQKFDECIRKMIHENDTILHAYSTDAFLGLPIPMQFIDLQKDLRIIQPMQRFFVYLIVVKTIIDLEMFFGLIYRTVNYNPQSKFLLVYKGIERIEGVFEILWKYYAINVLLIDDYLNVYTYYPLSRGNCSASQIELLCKCKDFRMGQFELFKEGYVKYFPNCVMNTYMSIEMHYTTSEGIEMAMFQGVLEQLKMKNYFLQSDYPDPGLDDQNNGTYQYMLGDLFKKKCDLVFGFISSYQRFCKDFDCSLPECVSHLAFFVPIAQPSEIWRNIFKIFSWHVWLSIFFAFLLMSAIWMGFDGSESFVNRCLYMFEIFFQSVPRQPSNFKIRILFLFWTLFCFLIIKGFESVMISFLNKPMYDAQITNVDELLMTDIKFGGFVFLKFYFSEKDSEQNVQLFDNFVQCNNTDMCLDRVVYARDFALLEDTRKVNHMMNSKKQKAYQLPTTITAFPCFILDKGSPYKDRINEAISRLYENGFQLKWDKNTHLNREEEANDVIALGLEHLKSTFGIYAFGIFISILGFLWEIKLILIRR